VISRRGEDEGPFAKLLLQVKGNLPEHPGGAWKFSTEKVPVGIDSHSGKQINATRPLWEEFDTASTTESAIGSDKKPGPQSHYGQVFPIWLQMQFRHLAPGTPLPSSQVKADAIAQKVASASWWGEHSDKFLEKQNFNGTWWCRPIEAKTSY